MARTVIAAGDDEPIDPRVAAQFRELLAAMAPQPRLYLPKLARMQASIDGILRTPMLEFQRVQREALAVAVLPKIDVARLTGAREAMAAALTVRPKFSVAPPREALAAGTLLYPQLVERIRTVFTAAVPRLDLSELAGFERVAEGVAQASDVDELEHLAEAVEAVLPNRSFDDLASLIDPELIRWAASIDVETVEADQECVVEADTGDREQLRMHLTAVAAWLYSSAVQLRAGVVWVNKAVDVVNTNVERYTKLSINLLALYGALIALSHLL